jgi:hypothetical protein
MKNDDADEHLLAGIDLQAWRVPPPPAAARRPILVRALAPAPTKQPRFAWLLAGLALAIAAFIAIVVIILRSSDVPAPAPVTAPAGGGSLDAQVQTVLHRLEAEQRELERRLAEIEEMRATIDELTARLRRYEASERRDRTLAKEPKRDTPRTPAVPAPAPAVEAVEDATTDKSCDEVYCVLQNYKGACCAKYRKPTTRGPFTVLPELDRRMISAGIASVKAAVAACGTASTPKGMVKVNVRVADVGVVAEVKVTQTPDAALGRCVANAVQRAVFERTANGGSFTYPFVF